MDGTGRKNMFSTDKSPLTSAVAEGWSSLGPSFWMKQGPETTGEGLAGLGP